MKISLASNIIFHWYGIPGGMKMLKECGFDAIDFDLGWMQHWACLDNPELTRWESASEDELLEHMRPYKEAAAEHDIVFGQLHATYPTYHKTEEGRRRIDHLMNRQVMLCGYLDCPRLVIHPGYLEYYEQLTDEETWDANIRLFSSLIPALKNTM